MISRNALLGALCFVIYEGMFWRGGIRLWRGELGAIFPCLIAVIAFALFITFAAKEVRHTQS